MHEIKGRHLTKKRELGEPAEGHTRGEGSYTKGDAESHYANDKPFAW